MVLSNALIRKHSLPSPLLKSNSLKEKSTADAEVNLSKTPFSPTKSGPSDLSLDISRPDTVPSGSVTQADLENRRKDAVIVQDFLKETMAREILQKELEGLKQEIINISNEKTQLKKLLAEKESLLVEKDKKLSETQSSNDTSRAEHSSFVDQMEKKFSFEAEDLREKKEKLEVELAEAKAKKSTQKALLCASFKS